MKATKETTIIEVPEIAPPALPPVTTPATLLGIAIAQNSDLDRLEKLMEMQLKWEANEARKSYHDAMANFKQNPPEISKDKYVKFKTKIGVTEYKHASLFNVTNEINKCLSEHGLSASWRISQANGITVTCVISHRLGHCESTSLTAPCDSSGGKNIIQSVGSTISYLERYTLLSLTGLATKDMDDDGNKSESVKTYFINETQEADLIAMLTEKNVLVEEVFKMWKISKLSELTVVNFKKSINMLEKM